MKEQGIVDFEVELDSWMVVHWITKNRCNTWYLEDFWEEVMASLQGLNVCIKHIFREGNQAADFLAQ